MGCRPRWAQEGASTPMGRRWRQVQRGLASASVSPQAAWHSASSAALAEAARLLSVPATDAVCSGSAAIGGIRERRRSIQFEVEWPLLGWSREQPARTAPRTMLSVLPLLRFCLLRVRLRASRFMRGAGRSAAVVRCSPGGSRRCCRRYSCLRAGQGSSASGRLGMLAACRGGLQQAAGAGGQRRGRCSGEAARLGAIWMASRS